MSLSLVVKYVPPVRRVAAQFEPNQTCVHEIVQIIRRRSGETFHTHMRPHQTHELNETQQTASASGTEERSDYANTSEVTMQADLCRNSLLVHLLWRPILPLCLCVGVGCGGATCGPTKAQRVVIMNSGQPASPASTASRSFVPCCLIQNAWFRIAFYELGL